MARRTSILIALRSDAASDRYFLLRSSIQARAHERGAFFSIHLRIVNMPKASGEKRALRASWVRLFTGSNRGHIFGLIQTSDKLNFKSRTRTFKPLLF
jgi:hypothetical protein